MLRMTSLRSRPRAHGPGGPQVRNQTADLLIVDAKPELFRDETVNVNTLMIAERAPR